jgi:Ca2+/H+ antiporter
VTVSGHAGAERCADVGPARCIHLVLGLDAPGMVLLVLTFVLSMLTFGTGRTNILFGLVHRGVFAIFLFLLFVP